MIEKKRLIALVQIWLDSGEPCVIFINYLIMQKILIYYLFDKTVILSSFNYYYKIPQ